VGSIGVIAQWVNYGELLKWAKMKDIVFKTGESGHGQSYSAMLTPAEQQYLQSLIDNMFGQFVKAVADGRGLKSMTSSPSPTAKSGLARKRCR